MVARGRSKNAPTGLVVVLELMPVGEHSICSRKGTGGYGIRPYDFGCFLDLLPVGEDIILPLFIKISLRFARDAEDDVPYKFKFFLH